VPWVDVVADGANETFLLTERTSVSAVGHDGYPATLSKTIIGVSMTISPRLSGSRFWTLVSGLASLWLLASSALSAATVDRHGIRLQDEIVLVNTRPLGCRCDPEIMATGLHVEQYTCIDETGSRCWNATSLESFITADPSVTTIVFVHGNKIAPGEDKQRGLDVYRRLLRHESDSGPIRFVIFSWPSSKIQGLLKDYKIKAARTRPVGWQLAWLIDQLPGETPVGLVGYSYGARVVTGALHILGGGDLHGLSLPERIHPNRAPLRVGLLGAALHAHWLGPGQYHGLAMSQIDRLLLLNNRKDLAMKFYYLSSSHGHPQALGLKGPTYIGPEASKICKRDLSRAIGNEHDLYRYLAVPSAIRQTWHYVSFAEVQ